MSTKSTKSTKSTQPNPILGYVLCHADSAWLTGPALIDIDGIICWGDYGHLFKSRRQIWRLIEKSNKRRELRGFRPLEHSSMKILPIRALGSA